MARTADNVAVGANGIISVAPLGTALPTTATAALGAAFVDVGYISDAGVKEAQPTDSSSINAWGGDRVRDNQTSHALEYEFEMIETSDATLVLFYGDEVELTSVVLPRQAWVIDTLDGDKVMRRCIPDARIISRTEVQLTDKDAIGYGVKLSCYPDANGVKRYLYSDDGVS